MAPCSMEPWLLNFSLVNKPADSRTETPTLPAQNALAPASPAPAPSGPTSLKLPPAH
jgi:hypothetical protein